MLSPIMTKPGTLGSEGSEVWLKATETQDLIKALTARGDAVRFVGGCVRDGLLGRAVSDVDLATPAKPEHVLALLKAAKIPSFAPGLLHGTVSARIGERSFEITTLRVDVATDGRHADVAFTEDWEADARRRDFTMNAIYADPDGTLFDPLGGAADARAGRVRFIGDAGARIREDYLRILRLFRFHASYGREDIARAALDACTAEKDGLSSLSGERIAQELFKLLAAPEGPKAARLMATCGLWDVLPSAGARMALYERLHEIYAAAFFPQEPLLCLAALCADGEAARAASARLKLSKDDAARVCALFDETDNLACYLSMRELRRILYRRGQARVMDSIMLGWAQDPKKKNGIQWRALRAMAETWERPQFPLTGDMVRAAGVPDGPETGRIMREVEDWWVDADFMDDPFSLIERLKAVVQATIY